MYDVNHVDWILCSSRDNVSIAIALYRKKRDPLLFQHIFTVTKMNCMKITIGRGCVASCEYGINLCDFLIILCRYRYK